MKEFDKLPDEYFALIKQDMPEFSRKRLWIGLLFFAQFVLVSNPILRIGVPVADFVLNGLRILMILWVIPCLFFSSKNKLLHHKSTYIILNIIMWALFRIMILQFLAIQSARMYSNNWDHPKPIVTNITYGVAAVILVEELVVNILAWKHMKKCIIAGEFKANGNGFFGENNQHMKKLWTIVAGASPTVILLSFGLIKLRKILDSFGIYIDGHGVVGPLSALFFILYHILLYIFAYMTSKSLVQFYYIKRFEQNTLEFKADTEEYGLGYVFIKLILAVILICVICVLAILIGQKSMGLR